MLQLARKRLLSKKKRVNSREKWKTFLVIFLFYEWDWENKKTADLHKTSLQLQRLQFRLLQLQRAQR